MKGGDEFRLITGGFAKINQNREKERRNKK